jgi:hypothetical protein
MLGSANSQTLVKNGYSITTRPSVVAEWNHNLVNTPRICGSLTAAPSADTFISLTTNGITGVSSYRKALDSRVLSFAKEISFSEALTNSYSSDYISFPVVSSKAYKITFFAKSSSASTETLLIRFREMQSSTVLDSASSKAFNIDNIDYTKHEHFIKAKNSNANTIIMNLAVDVAGTVNISDFSVVEVTNSEYQSSHLFNIKDTFSGFRPGEEIVETADTNTPLSDIVYQYRYGNDNTINPSSDGKIYAPQYQRFSYYCQTYDNSQTNGVFAVYDKEIAVNKLVIKMLNGNSTQQNNDYNNSILSYKVYVYSGATPTWSEITGTLGDFSKNGYLKLYYNGTSWSATESSSTITPSGTSLTNNVLIKGIAVTVTSFGYHNGTSATAYAGPTSFVTKSAKITNVTASSGTVTYTAANTFTAGDVISISGVVTTQGTDAYNLKNVVVATATTTNFTVTNAATGTYSSGGMAVKPTKYDSTVRYLEVSPRLQIDLSDKVIGFSRSAELESGDLPIATGLSTSNSAELSLENISIPVNDTTAFSIFSDTSGRSPFSKYDLLKKDTKIKIKYSMIDNANNTTTDSSIPFFTGYVEEWSLSDRVASITMFDIGKYLQTKKSEDIMLINSKSTNLKVSNIIETLLQQNGFSDYGTIPSSLDQVIPNYYIDNQKTVWDSLQELMLPYAYFGYIDEEGKLQISSYSDKNSVSPVFKFTDTPISGYLSNIIEFSPNKKEKPSEIIVRYSTISSKFNTDTAKDNVDRLKFSRTRVKDFWEYGKDEYLGYSRLAKTLEADAIEMELDTSNWNSGTFGWAQYSGYAVIGTEIIKYNGMEIKYTLNNGTQGVAIVRSEEEFVNLQYEIYGSQEINLNRTTTFTYTGKLVNLERGMFGTKARKHVVFNSKAVGANGSLSSLTNLYSSPSPIIKVQTIPDRSTSFTPTDIATLTTKYINPFTDKKTGEKYFQVFSPTNGQTRLWWSGADNAAFDTYGFMFKMPIQNESAVASKEKVGMFVKYSADGTGVFLEITPKSNASRSAGVRLYMIHDNGGTLKRTEIASSSYRLASPDMSRFSTYKKNKDGSWKLDSNGNREIATQPKVWDFSEQVAMKFNGANLTVTINGKQLVWKNVNNPNGTTAIKVPTSIQGTGIGVYAGQYSTINLHTIYATSSTQKPFLVTPEISRVDLSKVVTDGYMDDIVPFYVTASPAVFGMTIINDELQSGPGFGYQVLKTVGAYEIGTAATTSLFKIRESQSVVSGIDATPFKIRFAYLNIGPQILPLKANSESFSALKATFYGLSKSDEIVFSKKINSQSINPNSNAIEIQSDWIQTEENAKIVAQRIEKGITNSLDTYTIQTFGNPLISIGDIVNLYYNQGGFNATGDSNPDKKYIVVSTDNQFDGGFSTTVKLRAINS